MVTGNFTYENMISEFLLFSAFDFPVIVTLMLKLEFFYICNSNDDICIALLDRDFRKEQRKQRGTRDKMCSIDKDDQHDSLSSRTSSRHSPRPYALMLGAQW